MLVSIISTASDDITQVSTQAATTGPGRDPTAGAGDATGGQPGAAGRSEAGARSRAGDVPNPGKAGGADGGPDGAEAPTRSRGGYAAAGGRWSGSAGAGGRASARGSVRGSARGLGWRVTPSNQSRDGWNHSMTAAAATTDDMKPPAAMPETKSGSASTLRPIRAPRLRCSTWKPSTPAAAAQPPATMARTRRMSITPCTPRPRPSPGGSARNFSTDCCVSRLCSPDTRSKTVSTTNTEPSMISQAARVTWRGRGGAEESVMPPVSRTPGRPTESAPRPAARRVGAVGPGHRPICADSTRSRGPTAPTRQAVRVSPASPRSTWTVPPSTTSPAISSRASGSPIAVWISRRSGRAPYAGS